MGADAFLVTTVPSASADLPFPWPMVFKGIGPPLRGQALRQRKYSHHRDGGSP
jgi:hypothetical protein